MRLIDSSKFDSTYRIVVGIISGIISINLFASLERFIADFNLLWFTVTILAAGVAMVCCIMSLTKSYTGTDKRLIGKICASIGLTTPTNLFHKLQIGDVLTFYAKQYDGTSDIPVTTNSTTWIITGKGRKYITFHGSTMESNQEIVFSLTKEQFDSKFESTRRWHNVIDLGDKTIYSKL